MLRRQVLLQPQLEAGQGARQEAAERIQHLRFGLKHFRVGKVPLEKDQSKVQSYTMVKFLGQVTFHYRVPVSVKYTEEKITPVGKVATQCVAAARRSQEARFTSAYYKGN